MELAEIEALVKDNPDAVAAIKAATESLGKLPDLEAKVGALAKLEQDVTNLKTVNADLLTQKDQWKKGQTGSQAEYNALLEKIAASDKKIEELSAGIQAKDAEATKAQAEKRETDLKALAIAAASSAKALRPDEEYIILKAKGLIGHDEKGQAFYHKLNDKGEPVKVKDAKELMDWWIGSDKTRQSAGGPQGVGGDHRGGAGENDTTPKSRTEARAALRNIFTPA